jgi:hypothetical protein
MPRHVAYIIATLSDDERSTIPWYRIVGNDGALTSKQLATHGKEHISRLRKEGVVVEPDGHIVNWPKVYWTWISAAIRIGSTPRGPYADPATPLLFPRNGEASRDEK